MPKAKPPPKCLLRTSARETPPVKPVAESQIEPRLSHVSRHGRRDDPAADIDRLQAPRSVRDPGL
jgi:hypothetical protein